MSRPLTRAKRARRNRPSSSLSCSERSTTQSDSSSERIGDALKQRGGGEGARAATGEPTGVEAYEAEGVASEGDAARTRKDAAAALPLRWRARAARTLAVASEVVETHATTATHRETAGRNPVR